MIVEHIQPVGHMVIKLLRRYRKVSDFSRMERKRSTDQLPDACMEHSFSDRCWVKGGEGRGQTSYRGSLLICCFYLNCILVDLFNHFSTSPNCCGCCDRKRWHFTVAGEDTAKKGDKCSYLGECGQDAKPQDTIQGTDKKHLMKLQIELKLGWIKTNHHGYSRL